MEPERVDIAGRVQSARSGDRAAQEWVARRVYETGMRLAAFSLGDRHLAQDVGQEAAIRAIRSLGRLRDPRSFEAWSYRICVGELRRAAKRRARQAWQPLEQVELESRDRLRHPEPFAEHEWVAPALAKLTERQRAVIALRYVHDLSDAQIATAIRVRQGTVRSLLSRAMAVLREEAEEQERKGVARDRVRTRPDLVPGMEVSQ